MKSASSSAPASAGSKPLPINARVAEPRPRAAFPLHDSDAHPEHGVRIFSMFYKLRGQTSPLLGLRDFDARDAKPGARSRWATRK